MNGKSEYLYEVQMAVFRTHGCESTHAESIPVREVFQGKVVWDGVVEVLDLIGHATARQCYAWGYQDGEGRWQYVAVLAVMPVDSPQRAVQAYIVSRAN